MRNVNAGVRSFEHRVAPYWMRLVHREPATSRHPRSGIADRLRAVFSCPKPSFYDCSRRAADLVIALAALLLFGPLLPLIALAIRLDSPGPIFYAQDRIGKERRRPGERRRGERVTPTGDRRSALRPGREFQMWKLRTMRIDAESDGPRLAGVDDPRVTRVGRILRRTRLDEVPQFVNIIRGEMALIGPRPERLCFIRHFEPSIPGYRNRLQVLPGITGLAQVRNGYDDGVESVRRKVDLDLQYIRSRGPRTDLRILMETVRVVISGRGAH